jgi:hypothetical protein
MKVRVVLTIFCLLTTLPASGEEASYIVVGGDLPVAAASNGYAQNVRLVAGGSAEVQVATTLAPIGAEGTYADILAGEIRDMPAGFELPRRLLSELRPELDAWQAATLVLEWAADSVSVDINDAGAQDAISVLDRGRGRCSGLANANVALLLAAGFEARTVSGLLIGDDGAIPHRWIECRLPGAGWVASDPTLGLWTVTPRHMVFADTVVDMPEVRVVKISKDGLERLPRHGGRLLRPNQGADLVCRLSASWPHPDSVAVIRGGGGEIRRARFDPDAHFSNLLPGKWVLEIVSGNVVVARRRFELKAGDFRSHVVDDGIEKTSRESGS